MRLRRTISRALNVHLALWFVLVGSIPLAASLRHGPVVVAAALAMALLPVPLYLALALWIDRNEREPRRLLVLTFLWGACVATAIALILNSIGEQLVGSAFGQEAGALYGGSISAPFVEECAKGAVLLVIYRRFRGEFNGVLDGIVYATVVGLGFAAMENVVYYGQGAAEHGVGGAISTFVERGVLSPFAHPLFTAMTGVGLGVAALSTARSTRLVAPLLGLGGAILLHSLWNTLLATSGTPAGLGAYVLIGVPLFGGVLVVVAKSVERERRTIARYLAYDVEHGRLTADELRVVVSGRERRRARRQARRVAGKDGCDGLTDFCQAACELAFLRERVARGLLEWDARSAEQDSLYEARLAELRGRLEGPPGHVSPLDPGLRWEERRSETVSRGE